MTKNKTFLKHVAIYFIIASISLTMLSCESSKIKPYNSLVADITNNDGDTSIEYSISTDRYKSYNAPEKHTVVFDGKEYTGNYNSTIYYTNRSFETHVYECDDGTEFTVYADDLSFSAISFLSANYYETRNNMPDVSNIELERVKQKMIDLVDTYIDVKKYKLEESHKEQGDIISYTCNYHMMFDNKQTTEGIGFGYDSKGNITSFGHVELGKFEKHFGVKVDNKKLEKSIDGRIKELYSKNPDIVTKNGKISYNIVNQKFYIFNDKLAIISEVCVDFYKNDAKSLGEKEEYQYGILLTTFLE